MCSINEQLNTKPLKDGQADVEEAQQDQVKREAETIGAATTLLHLGQVVTPQRERAAEHFGSPLLAQRS